jgi:hypothetical protein
MPSSEPGGGSPETAAQLGDTELTQNGGVRYRMAASSTRGVIDRDDDDDDDSD